MSKAFEAIKRIEESLRLAGANLPAPDINGTPESGVITGLSIALALVAQEVEALSTKAWDVGELVMVPREPTGAMLDEAMLALTGSIGGYESALVTSCYKAMLSAAPAPSPCTPSEAAKLAKQRPARNIDRINEHWLLTDEQLAAIINADRNKRNACRTEKPYMLDTRTMVFIQVWSEY